MRSVTFRYRDIAALTRELGREKPELPLPEGQRGDDGEWVLAVFKTDDGTATASAARIEKRSGGLALVFESRDWERVRSEIVTPQVPPTPRVAEHPPRSRGKKAAAPRSKREGAGPESRRGPSSKRGPTSKRGSALAPSPRTPRARARASMPPPSQSGTVLTRTLVPPAPAEIHEADALDHTLEAFAPEAARAGYSMPSKRVPCVLLVDDDEDTQAMIAEMLSAIDIHVELASDAEEALDRMVLEAFDLVILDWNLPGMSGLELCKELRRHPRFAPIPILFLTAKSGQRDLVDAFAAGADDFVAKPFRAPELGARLLALLRRAKIALSMPPPGE